MGTTLARSLSQLGYPIEVVVAKRASKARLAAQLTGPETLFLSSNQLNRPTSRQFERLARSSIILIATADDNLATVAKQLADLFTSRLTKAGRGKNIGPTRRIALHTSGALSSDVLQPLRAVGFALGSLHPLVSISDPLSATEPFHHAFFSVEGDPAAVRLARAIVGKLGGQSFSIASDKKALYHAAAVTSSGHIVALLDIALEMLVRCGLSSKRAQQVLMPLVQSTVANLAEEEPRRALTGPFARGDVATTKRHLVAIQSQKLPSALSAYILLGQRSISLARARHGKRFELDQMARILSDAQKLST